MTIRDLRPDDWPAVRAIYEEGIRKRRRDLRNRDAVVGSMGRRAHPVAARCQRDGSVVGWAALSPVSDRCCYGGVGEVSVYVAEEARGAGLGRSLLAELVERSEQAGYWTLSAGVFPENAASVRLHKACGFREVGIRERLGQLHGVWRDVVLLERRSTLVGT